MFCICGLGNPGIRYANNRHNVGFMIVDFLREYFSFEALTNKFSGEFCSGISLEKKIALFKPMLYMNNSGKALSQLINFYKITPNKIIVIHDEADLDFLRMKTKFGGCSAGHNGLKSIDQHIGNMYWRLRFGVGRSENNNINLADYVLSDFSRDELLSLEKILPEITKNIEKLIIDN